MKKIFFVAIAATLLAAGCQKTEVLNQVNPEDGTSMTFAPNMGKLTKAATAEGQGTTNLSEQDFRLWAFYVAADPQKGADANDVYDGMSNIIISDGPEGNAGNEWKANKTHFWPGKGKLLKFFAISADPATYGSEGSKTTTSEEGKTPSKVDVNATTNTMTVTGFTVNPANPDTDLMVADYTEAKQKEAEGQTNTVNFTFRHALTKVQFSFRNTETSMPVYVQQMYVERINTVADLTVNGATDETTMTWGVASVPAPFAGDYVNSDATTLEYEEAENIEDWNTAAATINPANYMELTDTYQPFTTWLVIPQDVYVAGETEPTTDLKVTIAYVIKSGDEYRQFVSTFSLGSASVVPTWGQNQYVKYNINLTPNIIGFSATVAPWDESTGNTNINE